MPAVQDYRNCCVGFECEYARFGNAITENESEIRLFRISVCMRAIDR